MREISRIKNYILYLKKECGLSVSLHTNDYGETIMYGELSMFNIHDNSYCVYVKSCPDVWRHCVACQSAVKERCKSGPFEGVCHAGVREFVYPINNGNEIIGFISVSGYKAENGLQYQAAISHKYGLSPLELGGAYCSLKEKMPPREYVDTLIFPLCDMLELACIKAKAIPEMEQCFGDKIQNYLKQNYMHNITSENICNHFSLQPHSHEPRLQCAQRHDDKRISDRSAHRKCKASSMPF